MKEESEHESKYNRYRMNGRRQRERKKEKAIAHFEAQSALVKIHIEIIESFKYAAPLLRSTK